MEFKGLEKKEEGKFITRYDLTYETEDNKKNKNILIVKILLKTPNIPGVTARQKGISCIKCADILFLCQRRAKVKACLRPWRPPAISERAAGTSDDSLHFYE